MLVSMTLRQLRYLCEIVRQGMHLSHAAAALPGDEQEQPAETRFADYPTESLTFGSWRALGSHSHPPEAYEDVSNDRGDQDRDMLTSAEE